MRKLHISIGLSLLLLLAQQGAVLHEISHLCHTSSLGVHVQADTGTELAKACELCLAFSQVANPACHSVHVPLFEPSACAAGCPRSSAVTAADAPSPRSRGPPSLRLNA